MKLSLRGIKFIVWNCKNNLYVYMLVFNCSHYKPKDTLSGQLYFTVGYVICFRLHAVFSLKALNATKLIASIVVLQTQIYSHLLPENLLHKTIHVQPIHKHILIR